ncbi:MAG: ABC transporter ATP-binding protein/permease [Sphingomonadales bacterium]|jgi:ATP-binding cassette subfamily B protein
MSDTQISEGFIAHWRRFAPYIWPKGDRELKTRISLALLLMLGAKATVLIVPFFYEKAVDILAEETHEGVAAAIGLIAAYATIRFLSTAFQYARDAIYVKVGQRAIRNLALDVFRHLHALSLRFHLERRTGGLSKAIERGTKSIDEMLYFIMFNIAPTLFELIAVAVIFQIKFGWVLVAIMAACVIAYIAYTAIITEWRTRLRREMVDEDTKANSRAIDSLLNYETVKYFGNEEHEARHYDMALRRFEKAANLSDSSLALLNIGQGFLTSICLGGAMAYIAIGIMEGRYTVGELVLVNALLMQLFRPLDILGWVYRNIKQGLVDMEYLFGLLDTEQEIKDHPNARDLKINGGAVEFDDVSFSYEERRQILHDISFKIPSGRTLAVVGHSGAGKSTLSRILYRFYTISGGRVLIDGQNIDELTQDSLRKAIGIVPQDTVLFNDTIAYNIGYGRTDASFKDIQDAARRAQIHNFIMSLPDQYETMVGERGLKLSGGEKQRVAIARTLLKDPPILILDEATSALDTKTEKEIQSALKEVSKDRTTLIIAHRLSTVVDADEIIVMDNGRIIERGKHPQLLSHAGIYATMWNEQQKATNLENSAV